MTTSNDLEAQIRQLPAGDRSRFRRRLRGVDRIAQPGRRQQVIARIAADVAAATARIELRRAAVPDRIAYPEELPIAARRPELLAAIRDNQVVIVAGETGSGKSTQLPKLCLEAGRGVAGMIGHTQPRRIAARSIATRIAEEIGTTVGATVGFTVRFSDQVGDTTLIKLMTDGILLAEIQRDRLLRAYDTIIIDEAHERSLNVDFLLGYMKKLLPKRPDLKLIVTSATIDTERFAAHFNDAPVVEVSGRAYPVELRYRPLDDPDLPEPQDQADGIAAAVVELYTEGTGDILVFCSGEREIRDAVDAITDLALPHTEVLPLYARLSLAEQHRIFSPHRGRRIVVATNVAETSLTVPGIRYVIDAGSARISRYGRRTKVQRLPIEPVARASADQRAGRCGRLGPGVCIRLYSEDDYLARPAFTDPEIQRTNLAAVILQMAAGDLGDIAAFPFLDPPDSHLIRDGIALLEELGALVPDRRGGHRITRLGRNLAWLPIDLRLGRMVLAAPEHDCLNEVLVIAAALAIQDPRDRPADKEEQADQRHARFRDETSDFLGWLRLWNHLRRARRDRTSSQFRRMCRDEFLNYRRIREWQDVHAQLREVAAEIGLSRNRRPADPDSIHRAVLTGLVSQVGKKDPDGYEYRGTRGTRFFISPGSALFKHAPPWLMTAELVETTRLWAYQVAPAEPEWIEEAAAHLVSRSYSDPWWDGRRGTAVATETTALLGLPLATDRVVPYSRIDPDAARQLFILGALVGDDWETQHRFAAHNREQIEEVLEIERRERRSDLLVDDEALFGFFDVRLPVDIVSTRHFDAWWRDARVKSPHLLDLSATDVIDPSVPPPDEAAFPPTWRHGDLAMPVEYEFDPTSPTDGMTVDVPIGALDRIDPTVFDWNVPGLRVELVTALLRSLPKAVRKQLAPIPDTAAGLVNADPEPGEGLITYLRRQVARLTGDIVGPDAFDLSKLPPHLRPTFRVVAADGTVLGSGDDLATLRDGFRVTAREALTESGHELEQSGLTSWSFGELPRRLTLDGAGPPVTVFPALVDEGDSVAVRLLATEIEQADAGWQGVIRLLSLSLPAAGNAVRPYLTKPTRDVISSSAYATVAAWADDCLSCVLASVLTETEALPWDAVAFDQLVDRARNALPDLLPTVVSTSVAILELANDNQARLAAVEKVVPAAAADMRLQQQQLVYPGFLVAVGADRLPDVHRYLEAVAYRAGRVAESPGRDAAAMATIHELEAEHHRLQELWPDSLAIIDLAWSLQELRVSLFAQQLGTREKVSAKRIRRAMEGVVSGG
jgi:ATP-dependent helicase HrpA